MAKASIGIIGVSGYGGGEALRIAAQHPSLDITRVYGHGSVGGTVGERYPAMAALSPKTARLKIEPFEPDDVDVDVLFASLPTGQSREALASVPDATKIVDIGGDHRLHHADVHGWTFGLADVLPDEIAGSTRVANPGCYPSAALLALAPLAKAGLIEDGPIIVDAKSGVSGAGRGGGDQLGYGEVNENTYGYRVMQHAHEPEIAAALKHVSGGVNVKRLAFVPHLIPMTRGILATCYVTSGASTNDAVQAARATYSESPFVRVTSEAPKTKHVQGSNAALVHYTADPNRKLICAMAVIDNLGKGAAGQAIQNANLMLGLDPATGLSALPLWP